MPTPFTALSAGRGPASASDASPRAGTAATLLADDGRPLAASWFEPATGAPRAVAVVSAATGVPRGHYRAFAEWLAARGYAVLTYDYRGIGGSRRGGARELRHEPASMRDWAVLDMSAALAAAEARRAGGRLPLLLVGHSFGGNCIAFARGVERADAILGVGAQLGEVRLFPGIHRWVGSAFFRVLPGLVRLHGHLPGWALGPRGQALPPQVARQWAAWGFRRGWAYADPAMHAHRSVAAVVAPVHLWSIDDDLTYGPRAAVDALAAQFRNAAVQRHHLRPVDVGAARLGHFGAFRATPGALLWRRLLAPLEQAVPALPTPQAG